MCESPYGGAHNNMAWNREKHLPEILCFSYRGWLTINLMTK